MQDSHLILWGGIFSLIGLGFFFYGKNKKKDLLFYTGVSLFIYPYFISNVLTMILVGTFLISFPYFYKILGQK
jgi:LPXTG-motif cell wall-anchored protein